MKNNTLHILPIKVGHIFSLLILLLSSACHSGKYYFLEGPAQGTYFHITYKGGNDYSFQIDSILKVFDKSLSEWDSASIISRINKNDIAVVADSLFIQLFNKAKQVNMESNGAFDITVGSLVKAWGFYRKNKTIPDSSDIKELLNYVGMDKVKLINGKVVKQNPHVILDVNAIAQGFSVDVVAGFLEKNGVENYMVEIGGELKSKGKNPDGKKWRVGIDKPVESNLQPGDDLQIIVEISNKAMATSGNYRRFVVENGIKYGHHLNPKTGYPSRNPLLSVTIVANDCVSADAYATACIVSGLNEAIEFLKKRKDLEGYLVYSDNNGNYQVFITDGLKKFIKK